MPEAERIDLSGPMTAQEFLAAARSLMDAEGVPPSNAVDALLRPGVLSDDALLDLARLGAIRALGDEEHRERATLGRVVGSNGRRDGVGLSGQRKAAIAMELIVSVGADGVRKALAQFTCADWTNLRTDCKNQIAGFRARLAVADEALAFLAKHHVETAAALPIAVRAQLSKRIASTWGTKADGTT